MKKLFLVLVSVVLVINSYTQYKQSFNSTWQFAKEMDSVFPEKLLSIDSDVSWERVSLPHTANIEPVEKGHSNGRAFVFIANSFLYLPLQKENN